MQNGATWWLAASLISLGWSGCARPRAPLGEPPPAEAAKAPAEGQAALPETPERLAVLTFDDEAGGARLFARAPGGKSPPALHQTVGPYDKGRLSVSWTQTVRGHERPADASGVETLFTMRLLADRGRVFFFLGALGTERPAEGTFAAQGVRGDLGTWTLGKSHRFRVDVDLWENVCDISVDGEVRARGVPLKRASPLRSVQFRDGGGLGLRGAGLEVAVDDVTIEYAGGGDRLLERHRTTPPNSNAPPARETPRKVGKNWTVPGEVVTDWVGNTFGSESHQNGFGRWVQNGIAPAAFAVTPDGTAIAGVGWDEAGRCVGLYKDGSVNTRLVAQYDMRGGHSAWGFGTANRAVAADGEWIYVGNRDGHLVRFRWKPGDLESHGWHDQLELGKEWTARSLAARDGRVAALFDTGDVRVWKASAEGFEPAGRWQAPEGARALCFAANGGLWIVAGDAVVKVTAAGEGAGAAIADAGSPSAVSLAPDGRTLLVCDNGPRQQVRFYDVSGASPRFLRAFGDEGGLRAGTPGVPGGPRTLWGLAGAGLDAAGNLYVGCCLHPHSRGTAIKAFDPEGRPLWDLQCHAFCDGYSFDPGADGASIVGVDELIGMDFGQPVGRGWSLKALTLDTIRYPDDPRLGNKHTHCTAVLRRPGGRRLLYTIGQQSGGFKLYAFEKGEGHVARYAGRVGKGGWAWSVDARGDIWTVVNTRALQDRTLRRIRFVRWDGDTPVFDTENPDIWPAPGYSKIERIQYDAGNDALYLGAFPLGVKDPAWGEVGSVLDRYDGWLAGAPRERRWRIEMPTDDEKLYPKSMIVEGDYVFTVQVKTTKGVSALVSVFRAEDGAFVGTMFPGDTVGGFSGWVDIFQGIAALRRKDGEYLVLVEENFRGKNILYRWRPAP
jgi:hypothetical protein